MFKRQVKNRHVRPQRQKWVARIAAVTSVMLAAAGLTFGIATTSAATVSIGPGFTYGGSYSSGWLGGYNINGNVVYCIEPGVLTPALGSNVPNAGIVTSTSVGAGNPRGDVRTLSSATLGKINYLVSEYGQTSNPVVAAAVSMAVRSVAHSTGYYGTATNNWGDAYYNNYDHTGAQWAQVKTLVAQYRSEAASYVPSAGSGSATMTFQVDHLNNYLGTLTIATLSPSSGVTGSIVLTNGIFQSTGTSTYSGSVSAGQALDIVGVPPTADGQPYKIYADATFTAPGGGNHAGQIRLWDQGARQKLAGPGGVVDTTFTAHAVDPYDRTVAFQPVITTAVADKYIEPGDQLVDNLDFSIQPDADGVVNDWAQYMNGEYLEITASGTVYGPFDSPPAQATEVPADAPVAGTATVTTEPEDGPNVTYSATTDAVAEESGYYTWVWEIDYDDQTALAQAYLPAPDPAEGLDGYYWVDDFGIEAETAIAVPTVVTTAETDILAGDRIRDVANVSGTVFEGARIGFEAFLQVDDTPTCDVSTLAYSSPRQPMNVAAEYTSPSFAPIRGGEYLWVATLYDDTGTVAWTADCGEPGETSAVTQHEVSTVAVPEVTADTNGEAYDTVTIDGYILPDTELTFDAYYGTDIDAPICDVDTNVFSSTPVLLDEGRVADLTIESEHFDLATSTIPAGAGYLFWVERLTTDGTLAHEGVCGEPSEITIVPDAEVTTFAVPLADLGEGESVFDTAVVSGYIPAGSELTFTAYLVKDGEESDATAANSELVFESTTPTVLGGVYGEEEFDSESFVPQKADGIVYGDSIYWVETLALADGTVLHEGLFGEPSEISALTDAGAIAAAAADNPPHIAYTGGNPAPVIALTGGLLLLTALFGFAHLRTRRKTAAA